MADYLYKTTLYWDTVNVIGIDAVQEAINVADFEDNYKNLTMKSSQIELAETTFVTELNYADFKAKLNGAKWTDITCITGKKTYELYGRLAVLDKNCTKTALAATTTYNKDYTVASNERWEIDSFGATTDNLDIMVALLYTDDGGSTWKHPNDPEATYIRRFFLQANQPQEVTFTEPIFADGNDSQVKIRIQIVNNNAVSSANIEAWFNGAILTK